ncbi:hypothetical protein A9Q84_08100 [Halobacteriovorax marinus]|uniref:Lipoprotein n=1 Tax=Halobacteriovorax marinus TaxID=97084 RepID=A0A1Y5FBS1_9BACT|nr:hypothetical protein A9Q84_08100 [Halobacteriovorax marinus]
MKKKVITLICFFISSGVMAEKFCYQFQVEKQAIEKLVFKTSSQKNFFEVVIKTKKKMFKNTYYCHLKHSILKCSGDDDSGLFEFDKNERSLTISNMTFGEPDSDSFKVTKTKEITGESCK